MLRTAASRFVQRSVRRSYTTDKVGAEAHKLAEEALAQKTSGGRKATLPKGDKKPAKAAGEKDNQWKAYAVGAGAVTGTALGVLFYYGKKINMNNRMAVLMLNIRSSIWRWSRRQGYYYASKLIYFSLFTDFLKQYVEENPLSAAYHRCTDRYKEFTQVNPIIIGLTTDSLERVC